MNALDRLTASPRSLWLDDTAYSARLLAQGQPPWLDAAALVAWRRQAQGLLKPDIAPLDLAPLVAAWLTAHGALTEAMAAKRRPVAPLRTLLADDDLRQHIGEVLRALHSALSAPLALMLPSPRRWLREAFRQAHGELPEVDEETIDSAAVYVADFLRELGEIGLGLVALVEAADDLPDSASALGAYQSTVNVAQHYRWPLGLVLPRTNGLTEASGFDFVIAPTALSTRPGLWLPDDFWTAEGPIPPPPPGGFRYAHIPEHAVPEQVLARLNALRG